MKALIYDILPDGTPRQLGIVPDSALTGRGNPFFLPDARQWNGAVMVGAKICRLGKDIPARFASRYYAEVLTAVHPTAGDTARPADEWGRDGSLMHSDYATATGADAATLAVLDSLVSDASQAMTLKTGDLVLMTCGITVPLGSARNDIEITSPAMGFPAFRLKIR